MINCFQNSTYQQDIARTFCKIKEDTLSSFSETRIFIPSKYVLFVKEHALVSRRMHCHNRTVSNKVQCFTYLLSCSQSKSSADVLAEGEKRVVAHRRLRVPEVLDELRRVLAADPRRTRRGHASRPGQSRPPPPATPCLLSLHSQLTRYFRKRDLGSGSHLEFFTYVRDKSHTAGITKTFQMRA